MNTAHAEPRWYRYQTMNCTDKTGRVVSATTVTDADELMIMTTGGSPSA